MFICIFLCTFLLAWLIFHPSSTENQNAIVESTIAFFNLLLVLCNNLLNRIIELWHIYKQYKYADFRICYIFISNLLYQYGISEYNPDPGCLIWQYDIPDLLEQNDKDFNTWQENSGLILLTDLLLLYFHGFGDIQYYLFRNWLLNFIDLSSHIIWLLNNRSIEETGYEFITEETELDYRLYLIFNGFPIFVLFELLFVVFLTILYYCTLLLMRVHAAPNKTDLF